MLLRVLHCPTDVGDHPQGLARAEREVGLDSWCVQLVPSPFGYQVDETLAPSGNPVAVEAKRWNLLLRALRRYDVVHCNFGRSILPTAAPELIGDDGRRREAVHVPGRLYARCLALRDLPLLRRAGKVIAVTFQGDDARQATGPNVSEFHRRLGSVVEPGYYTERGDRLKRRMISEFSRFADLIYYLNPDLGSFLPARARFVPYAHVDPLAWRPTGSGRLPDVPTIVHAPSHRGIKGTASVIEAVSQLQRDGVALDFRLVEGLRQQEARKIYERADLVVDQLLVGWYGGLAVESMALGKPVICFIDDELAGRFAPGPLLQELPIVRATPDDLYEVLRQLLTSGRDSHAELCRSAREFVERWHDPRSIAAGIGDEYAAVLESRHARGSPAASLYVRRSKRS